MTSPVAYWHVSDVKAELAEVTAAGATRWPRAPAARCGESCVATFTDTDGNVLGLIQDQ